MRLRTVLVVLAVAAVPVSPARADSGGVWVPSLEATQGFDKLSAFPDGTMYAQYLDSYARSKDAGKTWQLMPRPPRQYLGSSGIKFATPTVGWSVGGTSPAVPEDIATLVTGEDGVGDEVKRCGGLMPLHRTTDGGTTWRAVCVPHSKATDLTSRFGPGAYALAPYKDGKTLTLVGTESDYTKAPPPCGTYSDVLYTTHDAGAHWVRAQLPKGWTGGYRIQTYDTSTIGYLSYFWEEHETVNESCSSATVGLFLSRDGGKTFKKTYVCRPQPTCTSLAIVTRQRIIIGRTDGTTLVSKDGGATWRLGQRLFEYTWQKAIDTGQASPYMFWAQAMSFADAQHGFASTRGSGTWRTSNGGLSWTQEKSPECGFFPWGIGEIATGSATTAVTGGPQWISARVETPEAVDGCYPPTPQVVPAFVWRSADGRTGIRPDGSMVVG